MTTPEQNKDAFDELAERAMEFDSVTTPDQAQRWRNAEEAERRGTYWTGGPMCDWITELQATIEQLQVLIECRDCGEVPDWSNPACLDGWMPGYCPGCQAEDIAARNQEA